MVKSIIGRQPGQNPPIASGRITIPASKSHTIRALLIAAFAEGESRLQKPLHCSDTLSCREAIETLGAEVREEGEDWFVRGFGSRPKTVHPHIDVGNSGTTLYLTAALAALSETRISFDGDHQIRRRSAAPLLDALRNLGADIDSEQAGCAPFSVTGPLSPGNTEVDCPVSQYLSGLLLAAPLIQTPDRNESTHIKVSSLNEAPYVDITLDWLDFQGIEYKRQDWAWFQIPAGQQYRSFDRIIPGDWSSATFFLAAAAISGGTLILDGVDVHDSQGDRAVLDMLKSMGCEWEEVQGGVMLKGQPLTGCTIDLNSTPDALPAMAVTALFAKGETRLINVPQARMKETDRIAIMTTELRKLGIAVEELADGMVIQGTRNPSFASCVLNGHGDHRVVMALALASSGCVGDLLIEGAEAVNATFPDFFSLMEQALE